MTWPAGGGSLLTCTDALGRVIKLKEATDCTNDTGHLVSYGYDDLSRRISEGRANGTSSTGAYASTGALGSLNHNLVGSTGDATFTYGYNRALQLLSVTPSNDAYAWSNHYDVKRPYTTNALDQYTKVSSAKPTCDARGNLASDNIGGRPWTYANRSKHTAGAMKMITPNETEITGKWLTTQGRAVEDETCRRIADLVKSHLVELGRDQSGWDALYRDPTDGRFWELIYPQSELQGGGPPQLRYLPADDAKRKYGDTVVVS
jgi:YD repeat-containing protein